MIQHESDLGSAAASPKPGASVCGTAIDTPVSIEPAPKKQDPRAARETKLELLRDDLTSNISAMIATLEAALAMRAADDDIGLIYGLRRARAYWSAIAGSARDLVSIQGGE